MAKYWLKNRAIYSLVLAVLIGVLSTMLFVQPNVKTHSENLLLTSVYENSSIDYDIPSPTKTQLAEIEALDFVDDAFVLLNCLTNQLPMNQLQQIENNRNQSRRAGLQHLPDERSREGGRFPEGRHDRNHRRENTMIKTEKGKTTFKGSRSEIAADLTCIMQSALEETPVPFLIALETFSEELMNAQIVKDTVTDRQKMLAVVLSQLPKEELEALKKKAKGED